MEGRRAETGGDDTWEGSRGEPGGDPNEDLRRGKSFHYLEKIMFVVSKKDFVF